MVLWYHMSRPIPRAAIGKEARAAPAALMTPEPNDVEQSVRRVRRGCLFMALIVVALAVLFTSATGNLFYLTLLVLALFLAVFSRLVR